MQAGFYNAVRHAIRVDMAKTKDSTLKQKAHAAAYAKTWHQLNPERSRAIRYRYERKKAAANRMKSEAKKKAREFVAISVMCGLLE